MYRKKDSVTNHQVSKWRLWMDRWAEGKRGKCTNWVVRSINRRLSRLLALLRVPNYIFGDTGFPLFETQDSGLQICSEGGMPKTTAGIGLRAWKTLLEGVNGVNRLATKGKKYYRLPTKREKNYRLPTGNILTHWLPKWTDIIYIFFFRKESILYKYPLQNEGIEIGLQRVWKFLQNNPPSPTHYMRKMLFWLILKEKSFQYNGNLYLQKPTVPRWAQRQQFPLPTFSCHILKHKV